MQTKQRWMLPSARLQQKASTRDTVTVQVLHCPRCRGLGKHVSWDERDDTTFTVRYAWVPCEKCHGTGYLVTQLDATQEESRCP